MAARDTRTRTISRRPDTKSSSVCAGTAPRARKRKRRAAEATRIADVVMVLVPDELAPRVYRDEIAPNLRAGAALAFAHGFGVHCKKVVPPDNVDVFMVAPKGPGHLVRSEFARGGGGPCLVAVHQERSGKGRALP